MWMKRLRNSVLPSVVLGVALCVGGCTMSVVNPDGTVQVSEPDYQSIELLATASIAAWAAAQKDGVHKQDAVAVMQILDAINQHRLDGAPIIPEQWAPVIKKSVPMRYQGLAMILVVLTAHELDKYQLNTIVPTKDSPAQKVLDAIVQGAKTGLTPYLLGYEWYDLNAFPVGYSKV